MAHEIFEIIWNIVANELIRGCMSFKRLQCEILLSAEIVLIEPLQCAMQRLFLVHYRQVAQVTSCRAVHKVEVTSYHKAMEAIECRLPPHHSTAEQRHQAV